MLEDTCTHCGVMIKYWEPNGLAESGTWEHVWFEPLASKFAYSVSCVYAKLRTQIATPKSYTGNDQVTLFSKYVAIYGAKTATPKEQDPDVINIVEDHG